MSRMLVLGMAVALLAGGCSSPDQDPNGQDAPKVEREQVVAKSAPPALSEQGPRPGVLRELWRIKDVERGIGSGPVQVRLLAGQLFVGSGQGITAYDPRTGRERWRYREPGSRLSDYAVVGTSLVVRSTGGRRATVVTGLDAGTGALRWERQESPSWMSASGPAWAEGMIVYHIPGSAGSGELVAVDATTGATRWTREAPLTDGCRFRSDPDTDGSVLVLVELCGSGSPSTRRLSGFDPGDGTQLWSKETKAAGSSLAQDDEQRAWVRRGATLMMFDDRRPALIGRDGRELADLSAAGDCNQRRCSLLAAGDSLVVGIRDRFWTIKGGTARALESTAGSLAAAAGGDRLYGFRHSLTDDGGKPLLPSALEVTDPATGKMVKMPMPARLIRKDPTIPGQIHDVVPSWVGVGGGLLMVLASRDLVTYGTSPTDGPVELAGVPASDWPDACSLLRALRAKATDTEREANPARFGSVRLERKDCQVSYDRGPGTEYAYVLVEWVAPTADDAAALIDGKPMAGADEVEDRNGTGRSLLVRVGRYLLRINVDEPGNLPEVLAGVVKQLR